MKQLINTILLAGLFLFFSVSVHAQIRAGVRAGMNNSKLTGSYFDSSIDNGQENQSRTGYNTGVYLDIPLVYNLSIQPGLYLSSKGNKLYYEKTETKESQRLDLDTYKYYDVKETTSNTSETKREQTYLQVPVLLAYRYQLPLDLFLQVGIGPYFAYGLYGDIKNTTTSSRKVVPDKYGQNNSETNENSYPSFGESDDDQLRGNSSRFDTGISLLAAFGWKRVHIALGYDIGLKNTYIVPDLSDNKYISDKDKQKIESMDLKTRNLSLTVGFEF